MKISVFGISYTVRRIVCLANNKEFFSKQFLGGTVVIPKILFRIFSEDPNKIAEADTKFDNDALSGYSRPSLPLLPPERHLHLDQFDPTPNQKRMIVPDTKFLRVRKVVSEFREETLPVILFPLEHDEESNPGSIFLFRGDQLPLDFPTTPIQNDFTVILAPEHFSSGLNSLETARDHLDGGNTTGGTYICQIDLANLAKEFTIQCDSSYEQTIGDILRSTFQPVDSGSEDNSRGHNLAEFIKKGHFFDYILVRIGNSAVALLYRDSTGDIKVELIYHKNRTAPTKLPGLGDLAGYDTILSTCMIASISRAIKPTGSQSGGMGMPIVGVDAKADKFFAALKTGAEWSVASSFHSFEQGFLGPLADKDRKSDKSMLGLLKCMKSGPELFHGYISESDPEKTKSHEWPVVCCSVGVDAATSPNRFWRMALAQFGLSENSSEDIEAHTSELAKKYLVGGEIEGQSALNVPIVKIGKLNLVDRHEVEDYLYLQNLLLGYQNDKRRDRPLSIAVFGQPGSGKSFGVMQLVNEMSVDGGGFAKTALTINLSQLRSLDELSSAFHEIRDRCLGPTIPLVFFDEFDSDFNGRNFGWLKYFLVPMQDGAFIDKGREYHFGRAVFVFAGGVNHSFSEFNGRSRNPDFCDSKGPDFISRLRGVLNIRGMNKPEGDDIEHIYLLRRAVFLRKHLEDRFGTVRLGPLEDNLAEAFLKIPRFKHGTRSLQAIVDMCRTSHNERFQLGHLPPREQLDMHVDARAFLALAGVDSSSSRSD